MMTSSNGNIFRVTGRLCGEFTGPGEFPTQRPVTRSFDVFFDLRLNKRLSKQSWGWLFETQSCSLWRHRNEQAFTNSAGPFTIGVQPLWAILQTLMMLIESVNTTFVENVSTGVLHKNKQHYRYLSCKDKTKKPYDVLRHIQLHMSKYH